MFALFECPRSDSKRCHLIRYAERSSRVLVEGTLRRDGEAAAEWLKEEFSFPVL